jgi:hypothetical protein
LKSDEKEPTSGFPESFNNYLESPLWGKLLLPHHSILGVPRNGIFNNRVATIKRTTLGLAACVISETLMAHTTFYAGFNPTLPQFSGEALSGRTLLLL